MTRVKTPPVAALAAIALVAMLASVGAAPQADSQAPTPPPGTEANRSPPSKACTAARRRVEKEKSALESVKASIDRDRRARESCSTKGMCARYDESIRTLEQRRRRHETRLARFHDDTDRACPASR